MEQKKIITNISGVGQVEVNVLQSTNNEWWCNQIQDFVKNNQSRFEIIVIQNKKLQTADVFQSVLQRFISFIQAGGTPQTSNLIANHFTNWINTQNGNYSYKSSTSTNGSKVSGTSVIRPDKTYDGIL